MGSSNRVLYDSLYYPNIKPEGETALLGFPDNSAFNGDTFDLSLGNWEINSDWSLGKKYDTIICLRTAYFAKNPAKFLQKCSDHLNPNGVVYIDWGLGNHWRYDNYKIGWVKDGEHEAAYSDDNYLWSTVWDSSLKSDGSFQAFVFMSSRFGYDMENILQVIYKEVPSVLNFAQVKKIFDVEMSDAITLELPQGPSYYLFLKLRKKN